MKNVEVEMSRYTVSDKVKFLGSDTIYFVKKVETLPKMTYYLLIDEYGNERECYQARQLRKIK
jgi:hypothetical protein